MTGDPQEVPKIVEPIENTFDSVASRVLWLTKDGKKRLEKKPEK